MWNLLQNLLNGYPTLVWTVASLIGMAFMAMAFFTLGRRSAGTATLGNWKGRTETLFPMQIDKRVTSRRGGKLVEVQYALPSEPHKRRGGFILDRSMGGLGLILEEELKEGTHLVVLPAGASDHTPWVEMEVRNSRKDEDHWEVGCKFMHMPPYSTLVLFG